MIIQANDKDVNPLPLPLPVASKPDGPGGEDPRAALQFSQSLLPGTGPSDRAPTGPAIPWPGLRASGCAEVPVGHAGPHARRHGLHAVRPAGEDKPNVTLFFFKLLGLSGLCFFECLF